MAPAAAPATLTPLAGCRAGSVEDIASNPPRAAECRNVRCLASGNQHNWVGLPTRPICSSRFRWHVGGAFGANVPNARHMTARQCANVLAGGLPGSATESCDLHSALKGEAACCVAVRGGRGMR